jgi:hypothetical protein
MTKTFPLQFDPANPSMQQQPHNPEGDCNYARRAEAVQLRCLIRSTQ